MSGREQSMTDRDLDRLLGDWLGDGPGGASDAIADRAMLEIADMSQAGRGLGPRWAAIARPLTGRPDGGSNILRTVVLGASAILLAVSIGIGIGYQIGVIRDPDPAPGPVDPSHQSSPSTPAASASPVPAESPADDADAQLELFSNPGDGYEILLPRIWARAPETVPLGEQEATAFGSGRGAGTSGGPALVITIGEADGTITMCRPTCTAVTIASLGELEDLVVSTPPFFTTGPPEKHGDLVLAGEPARYESAGIRNNCLGCPDAYYHVYTIHEGRPVVLAFDYWTVQMGSITSEPEDLPFRPSTLDAILESFRFIDVEQPESVDGSRTFVAPDGSFQIRLPDDWEMIDGEDPAALYLERLNRSISIRAGNENGEIRTCDRPAGRWESCPSVIPASLDDLALSIGYHEGGAVLFQNPTLPTQSSGTLDGEPATSRWIAVWLPSGTPWMFHRVAAMHEGRPFIVRMDGPPPADRSAGFGSALLAGFTFVDSGEAAPADAPTIVQPESVDGFRTFTAPDGSFQIRLPNGWRARTGSDPAALYVRNVDSHWRLSGNTSKAPSLTITAGDADGRMRTCDEPAGDFEVCYDIVAASLEELAGGIRWTPITDTILDGEPAVVASISAYEPVADGAQWVTYVAAVHGGRPFLLRMWTGAEAGIDPILPGILEGFSFAP